MTSARLLAAAVLLCTACAFSQEQSASANRPNRTAEPENSAQATVSEPWKIVPNEPAELRAERNSLQQPQIEAFKIYRSPIAPDARSFRWVDSQPGDDTVCLKIRSYVVARDAKDSDSVHPVGYSTCQPASRYRLRTTQLQTDPSDR